MFPTYRVDLSIPSFHSISICFMSFEVLSLSACTFRVVTAATKLLQSCVTLCNPMVAQQAPLSMGFSRQEYWSGLPCPPSFRGSSWSRDRTCISYRVFFTTSDTWKTLRAVESESVKMLLVQSYPTPCNPMDYSPPGSNVHGILQARIMEWVAIFFSRGSSQPRDQTWISCITGGHFTVCATREAP